MKLPKLLFSRSKNPPKIAQIGVSQNAEKRCIVLQVPKGIERESVVIWQPLSAVYEPEITACTPKNLNDEVIAALNADFSAQQAVSFCEKIAIIHAVPAAFIWQQSAPFPAHLSLDNLYRQLLFYLKSHLPIELSQVYFDFHCEPSAPAAREQIVYIFALKKSYAKPLQQAKTAYPIGNQLMPMANVRLDSALFCQARGEKWLENQAQAEQGDDFSTLSPADQTLYLQALGASLWQKN